jgi:PAS domain S-box-containing protein
MPFVAMIERSAVAAVITNPRLPDNPIVACNRAFEDLTGYAREEILGRNCCFLAGQPETRLLREEIKAAVAEKRPLLAEIPNFKRDGTPFQNAVLIVPIFDSAGELIFFMGSQAEVGVSVVLGAESAVSREGRLGRLTLRQEQVLQFMIAGRRNKEIAQALGISERTVKMHRAAAIITLEVKGSADAIPLAVEAGWHLNRCLE